MNVGQRIREAREDLGMPQTVLARRVGVNRNTIGRYESGEHEPSFAMLESIARELRTEPAEFLREPAPLADAPRETGPPLVSQEERAPTLEDEQPTRESLSPEQQRFAASMRRAELDRVLKHLTLRLETLRDQAKERYQATDRQGLWALYVDSLLLGEGAESLLAHSSEEAEELGGETVEERRLRGRLEHRLEDLDELNDKIGDMWKELLDAESKAEIQAFLKELHPEAEPSEKDNVFDIFRRKRAV